MIKDKLSKLITRFPVTADDMADAKRQAQEEKGETHDILSAIQYS